MNDMLDQPELVVVSQYGADHPLLRSLASQLLELGVHFACTPQQDLPSTVPASLEGAKAIVLDPPALHQASSDPEAYARLLTFTRQGGYVFRLEDAIQNPAGLNLNPHAITDMLTFARASDIILHAGLMRRHSVLKKSPLGWDARALLPGMKQKVLAHMTCTCLGESTQHWWKAAQAFHRAGDQEVSNAFAENVRQLGSWKSEPIRNQDEVAGGFAAAWLYDQTGEMAPLTEVQARLDWLLKNGSRVRGVLTTGIRTNPLGFDCGQADEKDFHLMGCGARRDVTWTEALHRYGPCFSAVTRLTGERRYLQEALQWVAHLRDCHLRADGLLAHCSRAGRPAAPAWARGQNHALYGLLYMLEEMGPDDPDRHLPLDLLRTVGRALMRHQDRETGLWRNLIDHPDARLETSGTCAFVYIYARLSHQGWVADEFNDMVERGWTGLQHMHWRGGLAAHCRGTAASEDPVYYLARPQGWSDAPLWILTTLEMLASRAGRATHGQST